MKTRPLLMAGPLVTAVLEGRKTVTRRPVMPTLPPRVTWDQGSSLFVADGSALGVMRKCPCGVPGDLVYVRETWAVHWMFNDLSPLDLVAPSGERCEHRVDNLWFRADGEVSTGTAGCPDGMRGRWRPSLHMPKWASRLWLRVTSVHAERLQDIAADDCAAEGVVKAPGITDAQRLMCFIDSWNACYGGKPELQWARNPYVWVVRFERTDERSV